MDADVIVAGGGPIGLAVAIEARLAGLTVALCERRPVPIDKACGEGLMPGAVHTLDRIGVRPEGHPFVGIRYMDGARSVSHRFEAGTGIGVRRTVLHEAMWERAVELGVRFQSARVADVMSLSDEVNVRLEPAATDTRLRARWLAACDGLNSGIRRRLGLDAPSGRRGSGGGGKPGVARSVGRATRYGVRRHFRVRPWTDFVEVHWTPHAELYVTPVSDDVVGVAALGSRGIDFDSALAAASPVADRLAGAQHVSDLRGAGPLLQRTTRRTTGRVLLVGDASGYVDALTGEGIRIGLAEAHSAVQAMVAGRPEQYERAWRRLTRDYRFLTSALVGAATRPAVRRRIVPLACRLPRLYGTVVDRLAG